MRRTRSQFMPYLGFSPAALFAGAVGGAWYDPSDLSSLFQDTAGATPVTAAGQSVARINDKSGNGNHATQATAANCPTYQSDASGKYLLFDGVNDSLKATFASAQPWDRLAALQQLAWVNGNRIFGGAVATDGLLFQTGVTPQIALFDDLTAATNGGLAIGANGVVTERHNGASSRLAVNNGVYTTGNPGATTPGGITIAAENTGLLNTNIRLYGLVMRAGTLDDPTIARLRTWLGAKCGLVL